MCRHPFLRASRARCGRILTAALACFAGRTDGATWTWDGLSGPWSTATNWEPNTVPVSSATTALVFGGTGVSGYTAVHDLVSPFTLNSLVLQSSSIAEQTLIGGNLNFADNGTPPSIVQNGSGNFVVSLGLAGSVPLQFTGSVSGVTRLTGI